MDPIWTIVGSAITTGLALKIIEWLMKRADLKIDRDKEDRRELKVRTENLELLNVKQSQILDEWRIKYYDERLKVRELEMKVQYLMEQYAKANGKEVK